MPQEEGENPKEEPSSTEIAPDSQVHPTLAVRMASYRSRLIKSMRDHQPLIVLSSLMLILAGFIRGVSEEAAAYAATSAVVFIIALTASLVEDLTEDTDNIYLLSLTFLGVAVGLVLLLFVAWTLVKSLAVGFLLFSIVTQGAILVTVGAMTLSQITFYVDSFRSRRVPQRVRRAALLLTLLGVLGLALVIGVTPVIFSFGTEQPTITQVVLFAGLILAVISVIGNAEIKDRYVPKPQG